MKSTLLTISKLFLIAFIIILFVLWLMPVQIRIQEIKPVVKSSSSQVQNTENKQESQPVEAEDMVALLFGWSRPRVIPRPVSAKTPLPIIQAQEEYQVVAIRNAKIIGSDGITRYYCKKLAVQSGFWISFEETNSEGWRLLEIVPNTGYLVLHNNQRKIVRFER